MRRDEMLKSAVKARFSMPIFSQYPPAEKKFIRALIESATDFSNDILSSGLVMSAGCEWRR